jgi:flagellin-like protein
MRLKKGLSPVIATMLLVAIVIVIALIIFMWFKGIHEEAITKFDGTNSKNVKLFCQEVSFDADYSGGAVYIMNTGNVPIYKMKAQIYSTGSHSTETLETGWPEAGLNKGGVFSGTITGASIAEGSKIILVPVLIGETDSGEKAYTCEDRHGYEIIA